MSGGSLAPIENSPPGIHTIPAGAAEGGGALLIVVGWKTLVDALIAAAGVTRERRDETSHAPATTSRAATVTAKSWKFGRRVRVIDFEDFRRLATNYLS